MATDPKKHTTFAPGEVPKRSAAAGLAEAILSINDIVPVASATEQGQIVTGLSATSFPVGSGRPLATLRADARGLHRLEYSYGGVFVSASGVLSFASKGAADTWASTNAALLSAGDQCIVGSADRYVWTGVLWVPEGATSPHFVYKRDVRGAFSFTTGLTALQWDATPFEGALAGWSTSDQTTFTCVYPGFWQVAPQVTVGSATLGNVQIRKNGASVRIINSSAGGAGFQGIRLESLVPFAVGDTLDIAIQAGGTASGVTGPATNLQLDYVHP